MLRQSKRVQSCMDAIRHAVKIAEEAKKQFSFFSFGPELTKEQLKETAIAVAQQARKAFQAKEAIPITQA